MSDTVNTPGTSQDGKTFTEAQVEQIVKDRLTRDREARKLDAETEAEAIRAKAEKAQTELATATEKLKALEGTSATAAEISAKVETSWQEIEKAIPEDKRKLIPSKYSAAEKIEYLAQNRGAFFPEAGIVTPQSPSPAQVVQSGGEGKYGGYSGIEQWAQHDPMGYLKAQKEGKLPK